MSDWIQKIFREMLQRFSIRFPTYVPLSKVCAGRSLVSAPVSSPKSIYVVSNNPFRFTLTPPSPQPLTLVVELFVRAHNSERWLGSWRHDEYLHLRSECRIRRHMSKFFESQKYVAKVGKETNKQALEYFEWVWNCKNFIQRCQSSSNIVQSWDEFELQLQIPVTTLSLMFWNSSA